MQRVIWEGEKYTKVESYSMYSIDRYRYIHINYGKYIELFLKSLMNSCFCSSGKNKKNILFLLKTGQNELRDLRADF